LKEVVSKQMFTENRSSRLTFGSPWTPAVKVLIITNIAIYFAQEFVGFPSTHLFGLVPYKVLYEYALWQVVTYMFLHGGLMHVGLNMLMLWMFGVQLERLWGSKEFVQYYLITGIGAGIINIVFTPTSVIPTIGASGAIFGLLLAYGVTFPNNIIMLYFIIPIKAKYLVILGALLELLMMRSSPVDGVAHFAHLGGIAVGFIYIKTRPLFDKAYRKASGQVEERREAKQIKLHAQRLADLQSIRSEVDYLLGRVSRVGYDNLTEDEKSRLEEASRLLRMLDERSEELN
jgi:membrane associated rhomboid family serine protease